MGSKARDSNSWREAGRSAWNAGDRQEALRCYLEAMAAERSAGNMAQEMHDARHVADLHRDLGNFDEAYVVIHVVLGYYRENPPGDLELANTLRIAAIADMAYENDGRRLAYWREAGELYKKVGVEAGVQEARRQVARLAQEG